MALSSTLGKLTVPLMRDYSMGASYIAEGKAFHVHNVTMITGITGQTSHALTLATIYVGNRGGKAMVPLWARFSQSGTVAGGRIQYGIQIADVDQYTSGTALTVDALNHIAAGGSQVTAAHTATIPAFTAGNNFNAAAGEIFQTVSTVGEEVVTDLFPFAGFCIVKPGGALYIYTNAATTGPTWQYDVAWAEIEVS